MTLNTHEKDIMRLMILHHRWEVFPVLMRDNALPEERFIFATDHADVGLHRQVVLAGRALRTAGRLEPQADGERVGADDVPNLFVDVPHRLLVVAGAQHLGHDTKS